MTVPTRIALDHINRMSLAAFVAALGDIFEHAPWVAEATAAGRPYPTVGALHDAMMMVVRNASPEHRRRLIAGHPELAGKVARSGAMTEASREEQGSLGLDRLSDAEFDAFAKLNAAYAAKFGHPFIICVRRHTRDSILAAFARRLGNSAATEEATALDEIRHITRLRMAARVEGPGVPKIDGRLSTHVLDTVSGRPAAGVAVTLYEVGASARARLVETRTNADGRTDAPLLAGAPLRIGTYELVFDIGAYFSGRAIAAADPAFLGLVPIRFSIAEPEAHYHVPLLASPWSYSTYRGS